MSNLANTNGEYAPELDYESLPKYFKNCQDPESDWYSVAGVAIMGVNQPARIENLFRVMQKQYPKYDDLRKAILRLREGLLKTSAVVGFPKAINSLRTLQNSLPEDMRKDIGSSPELRTLPGKPEHIDRGNAFFRKLYGDNTDAIIETMGSSHADLPKVAILVYSEVYSECRVLPEASTVLCVFTATISINCAPQATAHAQGSINMGKSREDVKSAALMTIDIIRGLGGKLSPNDFTFLSEFGVTI